MKKVASLIVISFLLWAYAMYRVADGETGLVNWSRLEGIKVDVRLREHFFWFDVYW